MGVSVAVIRVAANTSTGTQDITTDDLGGLTPKAVLLIATRALTDGTAVDGAGFYWGVSDGTNEWTQSYEDRHAQASMNNEDEQDTTSSRILTVYDGTASSTVDGAANFDSFIADGVRIDWIDAPASAYLITAVFFAGTDLTAHASTQTLGDTADALIAVTTVGFEADMLITSILEGTSTLNPGWGMGVVHNDRAGTVIQRSVGHKNRDGFSSAFTGAMMRDGECITKLLATDALDWWGAAQSFDSDGFDIQLGNARQPGNHHIGWLALRFGSSPVVSSKVYTYSTPTGTGSHTDSNPDFEPQFVMYLANRAAAADTLEADADGGVVGVVAVDADDLYTNSISSEDAALDSNTQSLSDNTLNLPTHTGASGHAATLTSMGSTGPVWNYSATDGTARLWAALAIGVFEEAGGEEYEQAAAGGITPSGAAVKSAGKITSGALTPAGALLRSIGKLAAGSLTPSGVLIKQAGKIAGGTITPSGAALKTAGKVTSGSLTPSGALIRTAQKLLSGALAPAGGIIRAVSKLLAGVLGLAGGLAGEAEGESAPGDVELIELMPYAVELLEILPSAELIASSQDEIELLEISASVELIEIPQSHVELFDRR